jgi:hypothetical protein
MADAESATGTGEPPVEESEIQSTLKVLEVLREGLRTAGMEADADHVNEAHGLVDFHKPFIVRDEKQDKREHEDASVRNLSELDIGALVSMPDSPEDDTYRLAGYHRKEEYGNGVWGLVDPETGEFAGLVSDGAATTGAPKKVQFQGYAEISEGERQ